MVRWLSISMLSALALATPLPPSFCSLKDFKFSHHDGIGKGLLLPSEVAGCDAVEMWSTGLKGMAASFQSPSFPVQGGRRYRATFKVKTDKLVPASGGPGKGAAALTGSVYLHFFDANGDSGAWNPQFGTLAPSDTDGLWSEVTTDFVVPTTAVTAHFHLAFAAHTFTYSPNRMLGGLASGRCSIGGISLKDIEAAPPLPATIQVPEAALQTAIDQSFKCLHNSKQSGNFTVGAGYTISGNISPDLTFGLHGIRRTGHAEYVKTIQSQWEWHSPAASGHYDVGRVMGHINWPLGVDNLFSFTGDESYLKEKLPLVDASLGYVDLHADKDGLVTLIEKGQGHTGGGADWVDWYKTRLDGRTLQFHMWYARTLQRYAEIHAEFGDSFGNKTLAETYAKRAASLIQVLQEKLWTGSHWWTNPDYPDEGEWIDDSVWSIYHGIAGPDRGAQIWNRMDGNSTFFEGVPTRWGAFKTHHWDCSWFGRLGAGDIMARYKAGQQQKALRLLQRISAVIVEHENIYEGYDMNGCGLASCGCTTSGYGDYLEHCGGLIWAVVEGPFGVDFDSVGGSAGYAATVQPRFPSDWPMASMTTNLRGHKITLTWTNDAHADMAGLKLSAAGDGKALRIRVKGCKTLSEVMELMPGTDLTLECPKPSSVIV